MRNTLQCLQSQHTKGLEKVLRSPETKPEVKLALLGMELPGWITQARAEPYRKLNRGLAEK